jgi:hypothetical protein
MVLNIGVELLRPQSTLLQKAYRFSYSVRGEEGTRQRPLPSNPIVRLEQSDSALVLMMSFPYNIMITLSKKFITVTKKPE